MPLARILLALFMLGLPSAHRAFAADGPKLALIITNRDYPVEIGSLDGTHRDGERMAQALTSIGFEVVHARDLNKERTLAQVSAYVERLAKAGPDAIGFFYYAGHGAANSKYGENYVIPVGAPISSDAQLPLQAVKLGEIVDAIAATPAKANFVVFDACRNVPISYATRSGGHGLQKERQRRGMLVAFATDPGMTATDEGVYAQALAEELQKPGQEAVQVFRAVRRKVLSATGETQFPWTAEGLVEDIYFKPPLESAVNIPVPAPLNPTPGSLPPNDCDFLAASPYDKSRAVGGVMTAQLDSSRAIPACKQAVAAHPEEPRFKFQLARSLHFAKDYAGAAALYKELVASDYPVAITNFANLLDRGDGVAQDKAEAIRLWKKASDLGELIATTQLGTLYNTGNGVPQNKAEAVRLWKSASDEGEANAMTNLAGLYDKGDGVPQDKAEAYRLYKKAADRSEPRAINAIAARYYNGDASTGLNKEEASKLYRRAGDLGYAPALASLGSMYSRGDGVPTNKLEAATLYRRAADLGNTVGLNNLASMYVQGDGVAKDFAEAIRLYKRSADLGNSDALMQLGYMYDRAMGVTQDYAESVGFYKRAAALGNSMAINNLGWAYESGHGAPQDNKEALRLYKQAADLNNTIGMYNLGRLYDHGIGVTANKAEAVNWYRKSMEHNDFRAAVPLGAILLAGDGVPLDKAEAARVFRKAADTGNSEAMMRLGWMLYSGDGVAKDVVEAVKLFQKGSNLGHSGAMNDLGIAYRNGVGVPMNKAEAVKLFRKAAELGNARAGVNLANMYDLGEAVTKDPNTAADFVLVAIKKHDAFAINQAPYQTWSQNFRLALERLLKQEGVFGSAVDGKPGFALKGAVKRLSDKTVAPAQ